MGPAVFNDADTSNLLTAILDENDAGFYAAMAGKPDVNHAGGLPLEYAAEKRNFLYLRLLVLNGADIQHTVERLERNLAKIPRRHHYDGHSLRMIYEDPADEKPAVELEKMIKLLHNYQTTFAEKIAPVENLRVQQALAGELEALRRDLPEILHGKPLDKPMTLRKHVEMKG